MKTHVLYLAVIAVLTFFVFKKDNKALETNSFRTVSMTRSDSDVFYAYISPDIPEVHIVDKYQPELEYREINNITYPFLKGTDKMLVALDTSHSAKQWVWDVYSKNVLNGYQMVSIPDRIEILPEQYRLAISEHNKVHPNGKNRVGKAIVRALFHDTQFVRMYSDRPPVIDFDQF